LEELEVLEPLHEALEQGTLPHQLDLSPEQKKIILSPIILSPNSPYTP